MTLPRQVVPGRDYPLQGQVWPGLLAPREERILAGLGIVPRRCKWLMGRTAGKQLVRAMSTGESVPNTRISVLNQPSGEPFVLIEGRGGWGRAISLSHRSEVGMAAAPLDEAARIGADVETVEPRDPALVRQFYTDGEAQIVESASTPEHARQPAGDVAARGGVRANGRDRWVRTRSGNALLCAETFRTKCPASPSSA